MEDREVLKKYIRHVYDREGVDFLEDEYESVFSQEEWEILKSAQSEVIVEDENFIKGIKKNLV